MKIIIVLCLLIHLTGGKHGSDREKRQLMFPQNSIMQLAFAVVTPAQVPSRQITTNMGVMFNIDLPTNVSRWYPWRPDYRRKRSADTDQTFYNLLQTVLSINGLDGRACLQKSFCQMREISMHNNDIPHQILKLIFMPGQRLSGTLWEPQHHNISCNAAYPTCDLSLIDLFKHLYSSSWSFSQQ